MQGGGDQRAAGGPHTPGGRWHRVSRRRRRFLRIARYSIQLAHQGGTPPFRDHLVSTCVLYGIICGYIHIFTCYTDSIHIFRHANITVSCEQRLSYRRHWDEELGVSVTDDQPLIHHYQTYTDSAPQITVRADSKRYRYVVGMSVCGGACAIVRGGVWCAPVLQSFLSSHLETRGTRKRPLRRSHSTSTRPRASTCAAENGRNSRPRATPRPLSASSPNSATGRHLPPTYAT